jgi:hypothetical protein
MTSFRAAGLQVGMAQAADGGFFACLRVAVHIGPVAYAYVASNDVGSLTLSLAPSIQSLPASSRTCRTSNEAGASMAGPTHAVERCKSN